jgi:Flp pilus assembly protein TadG
MRIKRSESGAALVEMVVAMPLMLLVLLSLITAAQVADYALRVGNAARAGVQYGAQNEATAGDTQGMQNAATADAQYAGISAVAAPTFCQCADGSASTCGQGDCASSHRLEWVQVTASGTFATPLNMQIVPAPLRSITISQTATMRVAQ